MHNSQGFHVDLLIWDCRYKTFEKSENEDDVMKKWCRNREQLIEIWDFTPVIVHHEGKDTRGVGAVSSVFDRWINTAIRIVPRYWISPLMPSKERKVLVAGNYTLGCEKKVILDYPVHVFRNDKNLNMNAKNNWEWFIKSGALKKVDFINFIGYSCIK